MLTRSVLSTIGGTLASSMAAAWLARMRTGHAGRGLNCTAHWLHGNRAAETEGIDWSHTGTGFATNTAATFFWAALYNRALGKNPGYMRILVVTLAIGPVAALVDYRATPRRFTPGWELVLSRKDMALIYAAMAAGMAAGIPFARPRHKGGKK